MKTRKGLKKAFRSEDESRYQLMNVMKVQQHTKQMKYNP